MARQEIERLALFLGPGSGAVATPADLEPFLGVEPEASLSDAAVDAFGGRLGEAQAGLRRAAQEGEGGPAAVRAMGMHLGRLRRTLTLAKSGAGLQEAAKAAGRLLEAGARVPAPGARLDARRARPHPAGDPQRRPRSARPPARPTS